MNKENTECQIGHFLPFLEIDTLPLHGKIYDIELPYENS